MSALKRFWPSGKSTVIAALSTIVEWYDFTLFLYMATILSRVFFETSGQGLRLTLAGFAVAYVLRPLGAMVFGHLGDRYGRRMIMLVSMAMMMTSMGATTLLPGYDSGGQTSGVILLLLRCLMGFSVGGEGNAVVAYLVEEAAPHRRGWVVSWASAASEMGGLLAAAVSAACLSVFGLEGMVEYGWRIPFAIGTILAATVFCLRLSMDESSAFSRRKSQDEVPAAPLLSALRQERAAIAYGFAISAFGSITYYLGMTYVPTFLTALHVLNEQYALWISTGAAFLAIAITPPLGWLSDRWGRKTVLIMLGIFGIVVPMWAFALLASGQVASMWIGAGMLALLGGGVSAVGAVAAAELFDSKARLSGLAIGASSATALFGGLAPMLAQRWVESSQWVAAPGALMAATALFILPIFALMPETRPHRT